MTKDAPLKVAIIAGEASGDLLGADLVDALGHKIAPKGLQLIGVGGEGLMSKGLVSLFDYSELSIIGFSAVLRQLPKLLWRIRQTADVIIQSKPDILIIIDSPDFTHRVAKRIKAKLPDLPVVNYVCPTVWAWKPERAQKMRSYVDHVLSILPFEPDIVKALDGPQLTYVGHRLMEKQAMLAARAAQLNRAGPDDRPSSAYTFLLLPGSRRGELKSLLPVFKQSVHALQQAHPGCRLIMPTLKRFEAGLKQEVKSWSAPIEIVSGEDAKWQAIGQADAALAASGTILLELALARVPCISIYQPDFILRMMAHKITIWSGALPNLIAGYPVISEHYGNAIRPVALSKRLVRYAQNSPERTAICAAFDEVFEHMLVDQQPSELAADIVLDVIKEKRAV